MFKYISIDINDLGEVLNVLQRNHYSGVSYYQLGLHLGLLDRTLQIIATDYRKTNDRLLQCIRAWLCKDDKVEQKGSPTWTILKEALRKIGENAVANGIESEEESLLPMTVELQVFQSYEETLSRVIINPVELALILFGRKFISHSTYLEVTYSTNVATLITNHLLEEIRSLISLNSDNFLKFLEALDNYYETLATEMRYSYGKCKISRVNYNYKY